jgi:hypothetical protein
MSQSIPTLKITAPIMAFMLTACGAQRIESKPVAEFPNQAALAAIGAKPAARPKLSETAGPDVGWTIEETVPSSSDEAWQPQGPWESAFAEAAAGAARAPRLTRAMSCTARELGRFYLEHKTMPSDSLRRFLLGACGGLVMDVDISYLSADVPSEAKDEELFAQMGEKFRSRVQENLKDPSSLAGFWFGRREGRLVALTVFGEEKAQFKPFSPIPNAEGEVIIEGRLNEPAEYFVAYINQGRAGFARCDVDASVPRPSFRVVCRPAADDKTAWIQVLYARPKRVLTTPCAQVLMRRSDEAPVYERTTYAEPRQVGSAEEFTRAALEQLNRARGEAGLRPVTLAPKESATASQLAPHYFDAVINGADPAVQDTIALGLLAGWEVGGMIRDASFTSRVVPQTLDAGHWLTSALEMPIGRTTLFAPEIEQVAFGPLVLHGPDALGAVVAGYRFHHGNDHTNDVLLLLSRVAASRRQRNLSPPLRLGTMSEVMKKELEGVHQNKTQPIDALNAVLRQGVGRFGADMRGFVVEASSLDALELPEEIMRQEKLNLDIGVTHHKAPGAAWAQFTILVVYVDFGGGGGASTARAGQPSGQPSIL